MFALLQNAHKISCKRRASAIHAPASRVCTKPLPGFYDDACKSTDTSGPEQVPDSFDDSDSDDSDIMPDSEATTGYSESSDLENHIRDASSTATSENSIFSPAQGFQNHSPQGTVSVPARQESTQRLRDSIRSVINALNEWEGSTAAEDHYRSNHPHGEVQSHTLTVLEQAMSKLTPEDAAMVRTFVDAKFPFQGSVLGKRPAAMVDKQSAPMGGSGVKKSHPARARNKRHSTVVRQDFDSKLGPRRSLQASLQELTHFDPAQMLTLQRASYLGLNSQALLETYFLQFGSVERVMVCHTRPGHVGRTSAGRGMGFLVMRQTKDVARILAYGPEHVVQGTIVTVSPYVRHDLADVAGL